MPIYIEDEEASLLLTRYAELKHTNKTRALRELLKKELSTIERKSTAEERYSKIRKWLDPLPASEGFIPKQHYDWLSGEAAAADLSPKLRKELKRR
jgi:hypothetical protein